MLACSPDAPTCASVCAWACVCLGAHVSAPKRAHTFPSAWSASGSARRRSARRPRSTRTSAHGTPPRSPRWLRYAPLSAGGAPLRRTRWAGVRCGAAVLSGGTADVRARAYMCAHTRVGTRLSGRPHVYVQLRVGKDGIYVCKSMIESAGYTHTLCDGRCGWIGCMYAYGSGLVLPLRPCTAYLQLRSFSVSLPNLCIATYI